VQFAPTQAGLQQGRLRMQTDDPKMPVAEIGVSGVGASWPVLSLEPDTLDFGAVSVGKIGSIGVTLRNLGQVDLRIERREDMLIQNEPLFAMDVPSFPLVIPNDFLRRLTLTFSPYAPGTHTSILLIRSNDPRRRNLRVVLTGRGVIAGNPPVVVDLGVLGTQGGVVATLTPEFTWKFQDTPGDEQSAWQVQVGSQPGVKDDDLWDSGKQAGKRRSVVYDGLPLAWDRSYGVQPGIRRHGSRMSSERWTTGLRRCGSRPPMMGSV